MVVVVGGGGKLGQYRNLWCSFCRCFSQQQGILIDTSPDMNSITPSIYESDVCTCSVVYMRAGIGNDRLVLVFAATCSEMALRSVFV